MRLKTFCSLTIIPTLILILLLIASVDNYVPETQVYGQSIISHQNFKDVQFETISIILSENAIQLSRS